MKRCLLALCLLFFVSAALPAAPRNVILIVTDDQGQDAGCYGNKVIQTPNMDRLAADGTLFKYAYCATASCSASRSVILTGLYNHANAHYGHQHSYHHFASYDNVKSLPVLMGQAGYRTARIGKYHVAPEKVYQFDTELKSAAGHRNPVAMADNCKEFINQKSDKPFFLYFCTSDPHRGGGTVDDSPYKPDRFGNKPGGYPGVKEVVYDPKEVIVPPFLPDTPACRAELAQYYQSVSRVDQGLGRLLQILKDAGHYDDTLIVYISDHGIAMQGAKTTTYDPGLRSPCIVRNPYEKKRGVVTDAMVSWVDITPTILDFAGGLGKNQFQGRSFLPILATPKTKGWDEIFASHTFHEIT
ncbi:MAG: sulfatase, partial [Gemmataceae bacterium]